MKTLKLRDICTDIFAGATIFTNDELSRDYKNGGYRVIRLADIQNNEISFKDCLFYNTQDYKKNRYLLQNNDILISSRGTIFKVAIFYKEDTYKTIPSGFLTCIRLNLDLNISFNYVAAYLRHKENSIIMGEKNIKKQIDKKPKIQLKLSDIYNIEIPIISNKVQKELDKLSSKATSLLKESLQKTQEIENLIKGIK
ncbi:MAG: restriction endonuclease subunit S [Endomicrobium sp.]|jgi:mRNA-degrading endonuclease RelE of RelBE toxin-antitoxin system|nr:restriction endonuclease subunit S [Endomicrobium sp.]MDR2251748.1 restriction endonuclease subunit S [Endomicrobium sp.]MDR2818857.1 restriction endonuclease subunit S [Endomicrobium sp.]